MRTRLSRKDAKFLIEYVETNWPTYKLKLQGRWNDQTYTSDALASDERETMEKIFPPEDVDYVIRKLLFLIQLKMNGDRLRITYVLT